MFRKYIIFCLIIFLSLLNSYAIDWLNDQENQWLERNKGEILKLGFDSYTGMEYFTLNNDEYGFIYELTEIIESHLPLKISIDSNRNWSESFRGLQSGEIDILFGANETDERKKTMIFTKPLYKIPYSLLANRKSDIYVVGDLEQKRLGFIRNDIIMTLFPAQYKNINYTKIEFEDQKFGLKALENESIDAFISSGGSVIYNYLKTYKSIKEVKRLDRFTSDMTLSVKTGQDILASILDKLIIQYSNALSQKIINQTFLYNYKIMELSSTEVIWIKNKGEATIGVSKGYLPFEYFENNEFRGINASILKKISDLTNINFKPVSGDFNDLLELANNGEIDILNIAKTPERTNSFNFTIPFSKERDLIYGAKELPFVQDIYGLEGSTIAVIEGYWHKEMILKSSINVKIFETINLKESINALEDGNADYLIENKSVMKYFIQEWGKYNIIEKGLTSHSSFLYFGINKNKPELYGIIDKALSMIDLESAIQEGYNDIPHSGRQKQIIYQLILIFVLLIAMIALSFFAYKQAKALMQSRITEAHLKEKEELMYMDPMTKLFNRHYLYHKVEPFIDKWNYPQSVIVCDLNNLKSANDKWGHAIGDILLSTFGSIITDCFSSDDLLIRLGGDEFMIITIGKSIDLVEKSALNMERELSNSKIHTVKTQYEIPSAAYGIATRINLFEKSFEEMQIEADKKMYLSKRTMKKNSTEDS